MHEITIVREERLTVIMEIDGHEIVFTRKGNPKELYSPNLISDDLDLILQTVKLGEPLSSCEFHLAGTNIIRLIDSFCLDDALAAWKQHAQAFIGCDSTVRNVFYEFLGFTVSSHLQGSPFVEKAMEIGFAAKKESRVYQHRLAVLTERELGTVSNKDSALNSRNVIRQLPFEADDIRVEFVKSDHNTVTYSINGKNVTICLSKRAAALDAELISKAVRSIGDALKTKSVSLLEPIVKSLGGKAVLCIMSTLYLEESKELLVSYVQSQYTETRELPFPRKLFKDFFHSNPDSILPALELLDAVESTISDAAEYLVRTSVDELRSDKNRWILYRLKGGRPFKMTLAFDYGDSVNREVRDFLNDSAQMRINSQVEYASFVFGRWGYLDKGLRILESLGIHLQSILDIRPTDCMYLQTHLAQHAEYKEKTQRHILQVMKQLYDYVAKKKGVMTKSPFDFIHLPKRSEGVHTAPITIEALETIKSKIQSLPEHLRIAFTIAVLTGARASSICLLTVDAIVQTENGYELIVQHKKTEIQHTMSNRPTVTRWKLPDSFVQVLFEYIESTKSLRSGFDTPYLLVYNTPGYRKGSKRLPKVLSPSAFSEQIKKLMEKTPLFHTDGSLVKCNFMSIRAEFGRAMFASGASAEEVARALGNTPQVASVCYNTMKPNDEAELYHQHYEAAFASVRDRIERRHQEAAVIQFPSSIPPKPVMYGDCTSPEKKTCSKNNCDNCAQRLVCR